MAIQGWFQFKKIRLLLAWGSIPILLIFSRMNDASFRWCIVLMIAGELAQQGISIDYPQRDIHLHATPPLQVQVLPASDRA